MRRSGSWLLFASLPLFSGLAACSQSPSSSPKSDCTGQLFCDDFEHYATGATPSGAFAAQLKAGAITIDETQHYSGAKSVKLSTEAAAGSKRALLRLAASSVFPVPGNAFYGRMMFRLEAAPTTSVHWTLLQAGGLVEGQNYHALYRYGGQLPVVDNGVAGSQWMANYETPDSYAGTGPASDCYQHANGKVIPVSEWSCVEWHFDGPSNALSLWLDGEAVSGLNVTGTGQGCVAQPATFEWTAPRFDTLDVGWESYQTDDARTLWLDDIALSTERLGCPP
jgi:hypothetical protein